ncbi:MAG: head decoration protein [Alphaproteobacteria bacterium]|nr:head decoration protein [Alphaproteobacteria bacterium]
MPVLTASPTLGDLLKFELNASYSRETVTLKAGTSYPLGAVLGRITAGGEYRLSPAAEVVGDEGAEVAVAILLQAVDATDGAAVGLIAARGPVILAEGVLAFDTSVDQPDERTAKISQLAAQGLVARTTV